MLRRWRTAIALGTAAITACLIVDLLAIVIGAGAAGSIAVVLDPIAGILVALAIALVIFGVIARHRRHGRRCDANECNHRSTR